jgi:hypothetical protein
MTPRLAQREIALAGIALLAAVIALAVVLGRSGSDETLPKPVGTWNTVIAGVRGRADYGRRTACGIVLRPGTNGVSHAVLPCGAKIFVANGDTTVLTQVIDRPVAPGRAFELTAPLAAQLGLHGLQRVRWAYAGEPVH